MFGTCVKPPRVTGSKPSRTMFCRAVNAALSASFCILSDRSYGRTPVRPGGLLADLLPFQEYVQGVSHHLAHTALLAFQLFVEGEAPQLVHLVLIQLKC